MAVEDIEPEHVAEAVRRYIKGEVQRERHTFAPSTAELAKEARSCRFMAIYAGMPKWATAQIAPPIDDAMRAKVGQLMSGLAKTYGTKATEGRA